MMSFSSITKVIEKEGPRYNYLVLLSKDVASTNNVINAYKSQLQFPDLNYMEVDGETLKFNDLNNSIEKLPFMDRFSMVVVTNTKFVTEKGKDKNKVIRSLNKLKVPSHCILILQVYIDEDENIKRNKRLSKLENKGAIIVHSPKFTLLEGKEELNKRKIFVNNDIALYIYDRVEDNLDIFISECEKVSMLPEELITPTLLDTVITKAVINSVFDIIDAVIKEKNLKKGIEILTNLLEKGNHPLEIFGALNSQIKLIYYAKQFKINNQQSISLANKFKIHPYRAKIGFQQANLFTMDKLTELFVYCNYISETLKLSINPNLELEKVIIKLFK